MDRRDLGFDRCFYLRVGAHGRPAPLPAFSHQGRKIIRLAEAARLVNESSITSLLDVGCRGGELRKYLRPDIDYSGCDLFPGANVRYVGDILNLDIREHFDCVIALEILEHTDDPYAGFGKLASIASKCVVVSLPNCYSLTLKWNFLFHDRINGKYDFPIKRPEDRHKWVMNCREIRAFFDTQARVHGLGVRYSNVMLRLKTPKHQIASAILPHEWMVNSVIGVFSR